MFSDFQKLEELRRYSQAKGCRYCSKPVVFDRHIVNENGRMTALNLDLSIHRCWNSGKPPATNEEEIISSIIEFIAQVNTRLKTAQLRLVRESKQEVRR